MLNLRYIFNPINNSLDNRALAGKQHIYQCFCLSKGDQNALVYDTNGAYISCNPVTIIV